MSVDVMVNGRLWKEDLEAGETPGRFTVTSNGKRRTVDVSWIDAVTLSLIENGRAHEIRIHTRRENGAAGIEVDGAIYETSVAKRGRAQYPDTGARKAEDGPAASVSIKAPMPGRVVRLLVGIGDRVSARQGVVVVEAMKMENELRSPRGGIVREIAVAPGAAVESGALLLVIGTGD
jgi:biotin carboxyl carrier protein